MLGTIKKLPLVLFVAFPGTVFSQTQITPGHCSGYMPALLEYQAKSAEDRKVAESAGSHNLLMARRDREQAKSYVDNRPLLKELHQSQVASDFDSDHHFAENVANQQIAIFNSATAEQIQLEAAGFEAISNDMRQMSEVCEMILADAVRSGNNRALGSFFESITKGD